MPSIPSVFGRAPIRPCSASIARIKPASGKRREVRVSRKSCKQMQSNMEYPAGKELPAGAFCGTVEKTVYDIFRGGL